jgi:hypothetical protein
VNGIPWEVVHSVEVGVGLDFAWRFMTSVANWDDPPAQFELQGPFQTGVRGTTRMPGQEPWQWNIRAVSPMKEYTLEMMLDRASIFFEWRFEPLSEKRTQLTQHVFLQGENAAVYIEEMRSAFGSSLPAGMNKIALAMEQAAATATQIE